MNRRRCQKEGAVRRRDHDEVGHHHHHHPTAVALGVRTVVAVVKRDVVCSVVLSSSHRAWSMRYRKHSSRNRRRKSKALSTGTAVVVSSEAIVPSFLGEAVVSHPRWARRRRRGVRPPRSLIRLNEATGNDPRCGGTAPTKLQAPGAAAVEPLRRYGRVTECGRSTTTTPITERCRRRGDEAAFDVIHPLHVASPPLLS